MPPMPFRLGDRINPVFVPAAFLVATSMQVPMMGDAQRHDPLVADLATECSWLCESKVMCLARHSAAYQARL